MLYIYIYMYIKKKYIYIYKERERERGGERETFLLKETFVLRHWKISSFLKRYPELEK